MSPRLAILPLVFFILIAPGFANAQWQVNGAPAAIAAGDQEVPRAISDGSGGAIIVWPDTRSGDYDVYVQRLDAAGIPQWTAGGVALCAATGSQYEIAIVSDGAGGAIVAWSDPRTGFYDIYAQRIDAAGIPQWGADGVPVCKAADNQYTPTITADGSGGAIVAWIDYRSLTNYDIYAQRVNASGARLWTTDGVAICTAAGDQYYADRTIVADGSGGAIVTWQDLRNTTDFDIYARRIDASGVPQWTANGVALCTAAYDQELPRIASDESGGAVVAWRDYRNASDYDIYARRIDASGTPLWTSDGVALCTAASTQDAHKIVSDGSGGAIVTWNDYRNGNADIYVRRVNAAGMAPWTVDGVALCTAPNEQYYPEIVADGSGGAIVTWFDFRDSNYDVYALRVNASGIPQWTADGVAVTTEPRTQNYGTIASDGTGGVIIAWQDNRSGTLDIYAQRIEDRYGYWGHPEPNITSVADVPGDQGGKVKVNWTASDWDVLNLQTITHYSVWRATDPVAAASAVAAEPSLLLKPSDVTPEFSGRAYRIEHTATTDYYWELVGTQSAQYFAGYRFSADTSADSTSQGTMEHFFQVLSHTADNFVFWPSNAMSGHSTDNLAPAPPLFLSAQRVGADVHLSWNPVGAADLRDYAVYRATSSGVNPVPLNFLSSADDTALVDAAAPGGTLYYIVTAVDVHENQSDPSNEASVSPVTGVTGDTPSINGLTVLENYPNPFSGSTELQIGLAAPASISIDVYDVSGRLVRAFRVRDAAAGWQRVQFAGVDEAGRPLPSGVYFYLVTASSETITRKMVIAR